MPTIRKRGNRYHVQVRKKGQSPLTKSFSKKADALTWAKTVESEMERGVFLDTTQAQQQTVAEVLERYREEILPTLAATALTSDPFRLTTLKEHLGRLSLASLSPAQVSRYRDDRLKLVGPGSVAKELGLLSRVLNAAFKTWGINLPHGNPVSRINMPLSPPGRERRMSDDEQGRLLDALKHTPTMQSLVVFAMETGMRRSEICNMRWGHIQWKFQTLCIPKTKNGNPRTVPLSDKALEVLRSQQGSIGNHEDFPNTFVWGLEPHSVSQAFRRACKRAGIDNLHFHDLRHEATSRFFEKGLNTMEVSAITGHKDLRMLKRYTHIRAEALVGRLSP
ncbi:hypothetical protein CKO31_07790 [Thiohalocapsa halophila]|uniref:Tyr recombinase domain-containing protein n=1 Tax=Thiohalocapsa halophila TaxID=69359 RepID=A0ABS1CFG3_9GAMM|nr:site-specific integrase [Thiohalocapsa halophila]MBK1630646.1 hypothetical protein [Thiohalocapsa halophila]